MHSQPSLLRELSALSEPLPQRMGLDIKYVTDRRRFPTRHVDFSEDMLRHLALSPVCLVPIKLDLEFEGIRLSDSFSWNMNETCLTPEHFAELLISDLYLPHNAATYFLPMIAESIRDQCLEASIFAPLSNSERDASSRHAEGSLDDEDDVIESDNLVNVNLDIQIGELHIFDRFQWPIDNNEAFHQPWDRRRTQPQPQASSNSDGGESSPSSREPEVVDLRLLPTLPVTTPESFAQILAADLGIGGIMVPAVAFAIRDQVFNARLAEMQSRAKKKRKSFGAQTFTRAGVAFRDSDDEADYEPVLRLLDMDEVDRLNKEKGREARRLRRSQKFSQATGRVRNESPGIRFGSFDQLDPSVASPFQYHSTYQQELAASVEFGSYYHPAAHSQHVLYSQYVEGAGRFSSGSGGVDAHLVPPPPPDGGWQWIDQASAAGFVGPGPHWSALPHPPVGQWEETNSSQYRAGVSAAASESIYPQGHPPRPPPRPHTFAGQNGGAPAGVALWSGGVAMRGGVVGLHEEEEEEVEDDDDDDDVEGGGDQAVEDDDEEEGERLHSDDESYRDGHVGPADVEVEMEEEVEFANARKESGDYRVVVPAVNGSAEILIEQ
ncbi:hypothetical protein DFJ73DRAFT_837001 [Zopfochytrium polystomum]|nr:hypothetical protein DFJ73DRAFT_837001 [Zopfochytrium polystomum]